ncbi:hypothetical protein [Nioella aestuarii]|uniref:hypothetical protein n=1 Tax=Nioella aestuarii TaxID=1662864 RepID=UPI003D7F6032
MRKEQPTIHVGIDVSKDKLAVAIAGGVGHRPPHYAYQLVACDMRPMAGARSTASLTASHPKNAQTTSKTPGMLPSKPETL